MKKYEAPSLELLNMTSDIITVSGLLADLSASFDAMGTTDRGLTIHKASIFTFSKSIEHTFTNQSLLA